MNVGSVRERLRVAGEIVRAEPVMVPGGAISFAFLVTSRDPDFAATFAGEGLSVEPYVPPTGPAAEPVRSAAPLATSFATCAA